MVRQLVGAPVQLGIGEDLVPKDDRRLVRCRDVRRPRAFSDLGLVSVLTIDLDRRQLGYLGHEPLVYRDLSAVENLELFARLYRVDRPAERIGDLLERFGLAEARDLRVTAFSRGMTQRLALCRTLLHAPELLVLDEPHTALDDLGGALLDGELAALAETATLVVSTHDPDRLEPLATSHLALVAR